jgi:cell division transport system ATP-binding protein
MIIVDNVSKVFGTGVHGLSDISLQIDKGEFVFLIGQTGSGKTTLLRLLIRDILPSSGNIHVSDIDVVKIPSKKIPHLRKKIGIIFQDLKLLSDRTIFENVMLPFEIAGMSLLDAKKKAEEWLGKVGVLEHKDKFPIQLSGGELQRVAIARALMLAPDILLADEPTGNLDAKTANDIVNLLQEINKLHSTTILMVTHNVELLKQYTQPRVITLEKGRLVADTKSQVKKEALSSELPHLKEEINEFGFVEAGKVEKKEKIFKGKIKEKTK